MKCSIILERKSRLYNAGERIRGFVSIENAPIGSSFTNLTVQLDGSISSDAKIPGTEAPVSILPITLCKSSSVVSGDTTFNTSSMDFPFELPIIPQEGQYLLESYKGVLISVNYNIVATFAAPDSSKAKINNPPAIRVYINVPNLGLLGKANREKRPLNFEITPALVENSSTMANIPDFRIEGELESEVCQLDDEFNGWISVGHSSKEISSIELQLVRSETLITKEKSLKELSEVQNLQIVDGNIRKNLRVPLYMIFPRLFSCPTTFYEKYRIEFEVNLNVLFFDGYQISKTIPIHLIR